MTVGKAGSLLDENVLLSSATNGEYWYRDAVIYEVHVRAFQDSNGDGIGDFGGLVSRLDYLQELGVTAVWLLPFYPSPLRDDGYDIADYRHVHSSYGRLQDFKNLLREAHLRGLKVITELVLAHTSDEHPWFGRARVARPGTIRRNYYLWSDRADRFSEARVIFKDFESSNWTWDPLAQAYYWHRFYSHQPSLNYDNPSVQEAMLGVVDYWLRMGVDGLRLDAVPYLFAREGTTCENLPETFAFLRRLRAYVDERYTDRMLLAEANQWPEDAVAYMGDGDACHMAFHFPLMPRMFMAARQEDRFPIVDILTETPAAPEHCQWVLFLRNHDELTLEMVTDEERDYMYRAYAEDPQARVNVGIRRRLAPLLGNDRAMIEMMTGLLFSLPGTPILYYGDEIGMGDNIYLGDRNSVRTPMQWTPDSNAGFSRGNPQLLYLPVVSDPEYQPQAVNVDSQSQNPSSLLWWTRRLVAIRKRYRAFGRGDMQLLRADNRKVLAFLRTIGPERILVVVNLSRHAQATELDLSEHRNAVPVELLGGAEFPPIGDLPYLFTLAPHGFYWFSLEAHEPASTGSSPVLSVSAPWESVFSGTSKRRLEAALRFYIAGSRWFASKARRISRVRIADVVPVPTGAGRAYLAIVDVDLDSGSPETYVLPLSFAVDSVAEEVRRFHPEAVIAEISASRTSGVVYDAVWDPGLAPALVEVIERRRQLRGGAGRLVGAPTPHLRRLRGPEPVSLKPAPLAAEQSNTSIAVGDRFILKVLRRVEPGIHPSVELGRFLGEKARFEHAALVGGSVEYVREARRPVRTTVVTCEQYLVNEGDGWGYAIDSLRHWLEEALALPELAEELRQVPAADVLEAAESPAAEPGHLGAPLNRGWAFDLGCQTAELHLALSSSSGQPDMDPEPLTAIDRQALYHGARSLLRRSFRQARPLAERSAALARVLEAEAEIAARFRRITSTRVHCDRIRVHGDYHLGQVLWTGRDFVVIDFEGEPSRSLGQRRLKRPALVDVAGMVRSFHYASREASGLAVREAADPASTNLEPLLVLWYRSVAAAFVRGYLGRAAGSRFLPDSRDELAVMLDFCLLEKAVYEVGYEANSRPHLIEVPARGVIELLEPVT